LTKDCTVRFRAKCFDHADYPLLVPRSGETFNSVLAGPTCDSIDVLYENIALPQLEIGDVLLFDFHGRLHHRERDHVSTDFQKRKIVVID